MSHIDNLVTDQGWSELREFKPEPSIDFERMRAYRHQRLQNEIARADVGLCMIVNPISLRYAIDYQNYALFQSHIPSTYLFLSERGDRVLHNGYDSNAQIEDARKGQPLAFFDGGERLSHFAGLLADEIVNYLQEIGSTHSRVALEYVNPSLTRALADRGLTVVDGVQITEMARVIKSPDEIACIQWAVDVAEHGAMKMREALRPGISELQLWGILNYANLANQGGWHEGHMLASGPRINPWMQPASQRKIESGDLVGFDTDMVGPNGYFADLSRTFHCGPDKPTPRQREIYQLAKAEVDHNLALVKPGISFFEFQEKAFDVPEEFHQNAYSHIIHGVGMCDEYPAIRPRFRGENYYDGVLEPGMVICVESYMGAVGERDGVKLEQQVVVTETGYDLMTEFPFEESLL